jgi:hypothetical protein
VAQKIRKGKDMNLSDITLNFLINLLAGVVGIFIVLWIERQRRPIITMDLAQPNQIDSDDPLGRPVAKWLYVRIHNKSMHRWLAWVYNREPALTCKAWVSFYHLDGYRVYDREMNARWSETPEPNLIVTEINRNNNIGASSTAAPKNMVAAEKVTEKLQFSRLVNIQETVDIPPGESTNIDIAFRLKGEDECYGWCNESYLYNWKHPAWQLEKGRYIAKVRVKTGGKEFLDTFLIENSVPFEDFRLVHDPRLRKTLNC